MGNLVAWILTWDGQMMEGVVHRRTAKVTHLMVLATRLGDGWAWVVLGLAILFLDRPHAAHTLVAMGIGLLLDIPVYSLLKRAFSRPRPYQECRAVSCITSPPDQFSFPSGHTSVAFVVFATAGSFYSWLIPPLALLTVLIGASRVYLGAHYPSDVVAGAILGSLCGGIGLWAA